MKNKLDWFDDDWKWDVLPTRMLYELQALKPLCESNHSVGNIITVPSGINPRTTVASIQVLFRGIKASIHTCFVLSYAHVLGILHY